MIQQLGLLAFHFGACDELFSLSSGCKHPLNKKKIREMKTNRLINCAVTGMLAAALTTGESICSSPTALIVGMPTNGDAMSCTKRHLTESEITRTQHTCFRRGTTQESAIMNAENNTPCQQKPSDGMVLFCILDVEALDAILQENEQNCSDLQIDKFLSA